MKTAACPLFAFNEIRHDYPINRSISRAERPDVAHATAVMMINERASSFSIRGNGVPLVRQNTKTPTFPTAAFAAHESGDFKTKV